MRNTNLEKNKADLIHELKTEIGEITSWQINMSARLSNGVIIITICEKGKI